MNHLNEDQIKGIANVTLKDFSDIRFPLSTSQLSGLLHIKGCEACNEKVLNFLIENTSEEAI